MFLLQALLTTVLRLNRNVLLRIAFADYRLVVPDTMLSWTSAGVEEGGPCCPSDSSLKRESVAEVETALLSPAPIHSSRGSLMVLSATSLFSFAAVLF